jgi:zinc protease
MKKKIITTETQRRGADEVKSKKLKCKNKGFTFAFVLFTYFSLCLCASVVNTSAQETIPAPGPPRSIAIPAVKEVKLKNGLTVAVVERRGTPIVTVNLLLNAGARLEPPKDAGMAEMTASLLSKGTRTRTATQIAEQIEFLGATVNSGAGWNGANVSITATTDKIEQALLIMSDVIIHPSFSQTELELLKLQMTDGLTSELTQPGFLANYAASAYIFAEHPVGGTPESLNAITRTKIVDFYKEFYQPADATLIFVGDVTFLQAKTLTNKFFSTWRDTKRKEIIEALNEAPSTTPESVTVGKQDLGGILVIDLPNSGQASVNYGRVIYGGRADYSESANKAISAETFYSASVLNSVLGGGYSSRLNQEIRIKRGLSYGAGSGFAWRYDSSNFFTRAQTKNESAAEVAELVMIELRKLTETIVSQNELKPRKSVLSGTFGRNLEATNGLSATIADLYAFDITASELNTYVAKVEAVTPIQVKDFAAKNVLGGSLIIVGDYAKFKDDLAKRFPNMKVDVIKADELDLSKDNLRK